MAGQDRSAKDKAMASHLKSLGVKRTQMNCPLGHHLIGVGPVALLAHLNVCAGPRRKVVRRDG